MNYKLVKCIEECVANYADGQDVYYKLPSKYIRNMLGILDGDGIRYTNRNSETIAKYFNVGKPWVEQQNFLAIDKNMLLKKLKDKNEMLIWVIKIIRDPSHICYEKFKDLHAYKDSAYLVWFDEANQNWQHYCFAENIRIQDL